MSLLRSKNRISLLAFGLFLSACNGPIPQADLTFSRAPTTAELAARSNGFVDQTTQRLLDKHEQQELFKSLSLTVHDPAPEGALVDVGFFPGRTDGYAVYRDGTAAHLTNSGQMVVLDNLTPRIDRVIVAGPSRRRIIGLNPRGTNAAWNTANLTQQLVLRPQDTTFSQRQVFDAEPIEGAYLATAAEGGQLELWSLISGNLVRANSLNGIQPRSIAPGSPRGGVVFGTDAGEVRVWNGSGNTRLLYSHSGPVLNVQLLPRHGLIISASKDGTVKVFNRYHGTIVAEATFSRAVYDLKISPHEKYVMVVPANGAPRLIDLDTMAIRNLPAHPGGATTDFQFVGNGYAVSQQGAREIITWDVELPAPTGIIPVQFGDQITDFAIARPQNMVVVVTSDNLLQYYDLAEKEISATVLQLSTPIASVAVSDSGEWALVALADGRVIRMKIDPSQPIAARVR